MFKNSNVKKNSYLLYLIHLVVMLSPLSIHAEKLSWDITFILDQSGSMTAEDRSQYALLIPSIIADLSNEKDRVSLIGQDGCSTAPCPSLWELNIRNKNNFKASLPILPADSHFTAPLKTALQRHSSSRGYDKSLVSLVYDDANMQDKSQIQEIRQLIQASAQDGYVFVMGNQTAYQDLFGERKGNQVNDSKSLLNAYSEFFKQLFQAKNVPTGESSPNRINVQVSAGAEETWIVFTCNEEIKNVLELSGNPQSKRLDLKPRGTGFTYPSKGSQDLLSYKMVHIEKPDPGTWSFQVSSQCKSVSWINLSLYELPISEVKVNGKPYTGQPLDCHMSGCKVTAKVPPGSKPKGFVVSRGDSNHKATFTCDSSGECTTTYRPRNPNDRNLDIHFETDDAQSGEPLRIAPSQRSGFGQSQCQAHKPFIFPTYAQGGITYRHAITNSAQLPQPNPNDYQVILELGGQSYLPVKQESHRASPDDISSFPNLSSQDWVVYFTFQGISSNDVKLENGTMVTTENGATTKCPIDFDFLPSASLNIAIQDTHLKLKECTGVSENLESSCGDCGACNQQAFLIDYSRSTLSNDLSADLSIDQELPDGVQLFVDGQEVLSGQPTKVNLVRTGEQNLKAVLCSNYCPSAVSNHQLNFTLDAKRVLAPGTDQITPSQGSASTQLEVIGSSWLVCWLPQIKIALWTLLGLFILFGFIKPCRFPHSSKGQIPYVIKSSTSDQLEFITDQETAIRRKMPKIRWYGNDYAILHGSGALIKIDNSRKEGICKIDLKNCRPHIVAMSDSIYELSYLPGARANSYSIEGVTPLAKDELLPLSSHSIYYDHSSGYWFKFEV